MQVKVLDSKLTAYSEVRCARFQASLVGTAIEHIETQSALHTLYRAKVTVPRAACAGAGIGGYGYLDWV